MKRKILFLSCLVFLLQACALNQKKIVNENELDVALNKLIQDENLTFNQNENEIIQTLLTHSPSYAQKQQKKAVEKNMVKLPNNMPLYRQPLFAQMVVFPFISKNGIYHGYSESWIKIKDGEFVLSKQNSSSKDRMFTIEQIK